MFVLTKIFPRIIREFEDEQDEPMFYGGKLEWNKILENHLEKDLIL